MSWIKRLKMGLKDLGKKEVIAPIAAALFIVALLLSLGLTQFVRVGALTQDSYAVPKNSLNSSLRSGDVAEDIVLEDVKMGEEIFIRTFIDGEYYIGEERQIISGSYPLFTESGKVLYFLDDKLKLITNNWNTLDTYENLYLSDGITFNLDREQADFENINLVQVDGGYISAKEITLETNKIEAKIPMNSPLSFGQSTINYFEFKRGILIGKSINVSKDSIITIGEQRYNYLEFLEKLGLWEEENKRPNKKEDVKEKEKKVIEKEKQKTVEKEQQQILDKVTENNENLETSKGEAKLPKQAESSTQKIRKEKEYKDKNQSRPGNSSNQDIEEPEDPKPNPDEKPQEPEKPKPSPDPNPDYKDPEVSFENNIDPWVYTLTVKAHVNDPASVIQSGIKIFVYEIKEDGKTSQALRKIINQSGEVILGQLKPNQKYKIVAQYEYKDKLNYPQTKTIEIGESKTLPFDKVGNINIDFYDETNVPLGKKPVDIYGKKLQLRDLVLSNIKNNIETEPGGVGSHSEMNLRKAETYINNFNILATKVGTTKPVSISMDAQDLKALREGYTYTYWETGEKLISSSQYEYKLDLADRYGNKFLLEGKADGVGHTSKIEPEVTIMVPSKTNVANSTQLDINFKNPENATVDVNPEENSITEGKVKAALYLVKKGDIVSPENAITLEGYELGSKDKKFTGKFAPITINSSAEVTTTTTNWIITNLEVMQTYTAAVVCGAYDSEDNKLHHDETIKKTTDFVTASLANLGAISYTALVDELTDKTGRLKFRMNEADERLVALLDEITFDAKERNGIGNGEQISLKKSHLETAIITPSFNSVTGRYTGVVDGKIDYEGKSYTIQFTIDAAQLPSIEAGEETSLWQYIMSSAQTVTSDDFWICINIGQPFNEDEKEETLFRLKPSTEYAGNFKTMASQGGKQEDVTSSASKTIYFTMESEDALVNFENSFVSTDFIEVYELSVNDIAEAILPDDADRGGNNIVVKVIDKSGVTVTTQYINSKKTYDSLRLTGLKTNTEYNLVFTAYKYSKGKTGAVELNYDLKYENPQDKENPTIYKFTTGESVIGDISLTGISQLYQNVDGEPTDSIGLLTKDDFYYGILVSDTACFYYDEEIKTAYIDQVDEKEETEQLRELAKGNTPYFKLHPRTKFSTDINNQNDLKSGWTSKFIEINSGEKYVIHAPGAEKHLRVNFYYEDNGIIKSYGCFTVAELINGTVFTIPTTKGTGSINADKIKYMKIAGTRSQYIDNLYFDRYDEAAMTLSPELITDDIKIEENSSIGYANGIEVSSLYAHISDYIPVQAGSFYEIKGANQNVLGDRPQKNVSGVNNGIYFYDKNYVFIGRYNKSSYPSLVKAPSGAAYIRFNILMNQSSSGEKIDRSTLSLKMYKKSITDYYQAKLKVDLSDNSDVQLLDKGKYKVTMFMTTKNVTDSDDLYSMDYVQFGEGFEYEVTQEDMKNGKLNISKDIMVSKLPPGRGFRAELTILPPSWDGGKVNIDEVYFTTNSVVKTIENYSDLVAINQDPTGSYVVVNDIVEENINSRILDESKPFTGTLDFQGHTLDWKTVSGKGLFYRISKGGVIKNLVMNYSHKSESAESKLSNVGSIAIYNYGTIENVVINYKIDNNSSNYHTDFVNSGGISYQNYGTIRNFAIVVQSDVRVEHRYGLIAAENTGTISNGYIYLDEIEDKISGAKRAARVEHIMIDSQGSVVNTNTHSFALGVGVNSSTGIIQNVFALGDIYVQSADASNNRANADYLGSGVNKNPHYETSTINTASSALLIGNNSGTVKNAFTEGDRFDYDPIKNQTSVMIDRGPAIGVVGGKFNATNITYFSQETETYSQYTNIDKGIAFYNSKGAYESLYDYQWYENTLGKDDTGFVIRKNIEAGYYPQLVLPSMFDAEAQPKIPLPGKHGSDVEIQNNQVRSQGVDQALVTVTMKYPYAGNLNITKMDIVDRNNVKLDCEVLQQAIVGDSYRVDILISLPKDGSALADKLYTITGVYWTGGSQNFTGEGGNRIIHTNFSKYINDIQQWKEYFVNVTAPIQGSFSLANDLDFSEVSSHGDWLVKQIFYGTLDGGKYEQKEILLTDFLGKPILDKDGAQRKIKANGELIGMYEIRGIGNSDGKGNYVASRDTSYGGSLMLYMYGTAKNLVLKDFVTIKEKSLGTFSAGANIHHAGAFARVEEGALIDNVHIRDSQFYGYAEIGGITGRLMASTINNSSVKDVKIEGIRLSPTSTSNLMIGGLSSYVEGSEITNSFVADTTIKAVDVYTSSGIGGIAGNISHSLINSCYSTGSIDVGVGNVGSIAGNMTGTSEITGNWSTMSVTTVADFAGGILGKHSYGKLYNNYTASTLITRSLVASNVHRITSSTGFNENTRFDNYAFQGQYMTYIEDNPQNGESMYQFGIWDKPDGATKLLERSELVQPSLWINVIKIGEGFDELGEIRPDGTSGDTAQTTVEAGYMPKLVNWESNKLLYDQPTVEIGYVSESMLGKVAIQNNQATETLTVNLALFSDKDVLSPDFASIADWGSLVVIGGEVNKSYSVEGKASVEGIIDKGAYSDSLLGRTGRAFEFQVIYGEKAIEGHYLDSYIMSLPSTIGGVREDLQVRLSLEEPVYKAINNIYEWDAFFSNPKYTSSFENIKIDWNSTTDQGVIDFSGLNHKYNVRVNRLDGVSKNGEYPTIKNVDETFKVAGMSFVDQVVTYVSKLNFENISLSSTNGNTKYGGNNKGIVGNLYGHMKDVNFKNINIDGGSSAYVGIIGVASSLIENVAISDIKIESTHNNVGGLVGVAEVTSTIQNIKLDSTTRNQILSSSGRYVGGVVGILGGVGTDWKVNNTNVTGASVIGGAVGQLSGDGGRPNLKKLTNVIIGDESKVNRIPGATADPSMKVEMKYKDGTTSINDMRYLGGAIGQGGGTVSNVDVYDTTVTMEYFANDDPKIGEYSYSVGGVSGSSGILINSSATNCTIKSNGRYIGGVSGVNLGTQNTSKNNIVVGLQEKSMHVGGLVGNGSPSRSVSANNIIAGGSKVGGVSGVLSNSASNSSIDNIVVGKEDVGGIAGSGITGYIRNLYVGSSIDENGDPIIEKKVTSSILPNYLKSKAGIYKGTHIIGESNVGGIAGEMSAYDLHNSQVGTKVNIKGDKNIGGAAGLFYGFHQNYNPTVVRQINQIEIGADIEGGTNVGGLIGKYTKTEGNTSLATADTPVPERFHSILFTGNIKGNNVDPIMPGLPTDGSQMRYVRVYDKSSVQGYDINTLGTWDDAMTPYNLDKIKSTLSVTAENLADPIFFEGGVVYGGFGISPNAQNTLSMATMYETQVNPADFNSYQLGIKKDDLTVWLDARNNTGKGYTDEKATTWIDLTGKSNDAILKWNEKTIDEALTTSEKENYLRWDEGALEFVNTLEGCYAEIQNSLDNATSGDYTVEIVYSYTTPRVNNQTTLLGWQYSTGGKGGFNGPIYLNGANGRYRFDSTYLGTNTPETVQSFLRTATFVKSGDNISAFTNGNSAGPSVKGGVNPNDNRKWRIGYGLQGNNEKLRVSGVRIYSKALTEAEIQQHSAYDMWYYYGGAMPSSATKALASGITLNPDGTVSPTGKYKLLRSEDGSYNGTLVSENYEGQGLGSRGYYYLQSENGKYSNIVTKTSPNYAPAIMLESESTEYYGTAKYRYVPGQEGMNLSGDIYDCDDDMYYGGFRLPDAGVQQRNPNLSAFKKVMLKPVLSNVSLYSSGIDSVNIELDNVVQEEMVYKVTSKDNVVLEGIWPKGQRTITMTWDYASPFELSLETETAEFKAEYSSANFANTVMTYGDDFWYLYGGELHNSDNMSVKSDMLAVHLAEGKVLDGAGNILNITTLSQEGNVESFKLKETKSLWQGTIMGNEVTTFGAYSISNNNVIQTPIFLKDETVYTVSPENLKVGSVILDSYGENTYATSLNLLGQLIDSGNELVYPKDFVNSGIYQTSNTLNYDGNIVLIRYNSGQLVAFNYLTGEQLEVLSTVNDTTFLGYLGESLSGLGLPRFTTKYKQPSLWASQYQGEVESDLSLKNALESLKEGTYEGGGAGSSTDSDILTEGSEDSVGGGNSINPGTGKSNVSGDGEGVIIEGEFTDGPNTVNGEGGKKTTEELQTKTGMESEKNLTENEEKATKEAKEKTEKEAKTQNQSEKIEDRNTESSLGQNVSKDEKIEEVKALQNQEKEEAVKQELEEKNLAEKQEASEEISVKTKFVTVYGTEGEPEIYELKALLEKSTDQLISEEEYAKELEKMGFKTSLLQTGTNDSPKAKGVMLIIFTSIVAVIMLMALGFIKKRKFEDEETSNKN